MASQLDEVLKHQYVYVPRGIEKNPIQSGELLGLAVVRAYGARLTVVCAQRPNATRHPELAKPEIVTERSGYVNDGGVVLAWRRCGQLIEQLVATCAIIHEQLSLPILITIARRHYQEA